MGLPISVCTRSYTTSYTPLSEVVTVTVIRFSPDVYPTAIYHSLYIIVPRTLSNACPSPSVIISIGGNSATSCAGLSGVITIGIPRSSRAEVGATVVVRIGPAVSRAIGGRIPARKSAIDGVVIANAFNVVSEGVVGTLQ